MARVEQIGAANDVADILPGVVDDNREVITHAKPLPTQDDITDLLPDQPVSRRVRQQVRRPLRRN